MKISRFSHNFNFNQLICPSISFKDQQTNLHSWIALFSTYCSWLCLKTALFSFGQSENISFCIILLICNYVNYFSTLDDLLEEVTMFHVKPSSKKPKILLVQRLELPIIIIVETFSVTFEKYCFTSNKDFALSLRIYF